MEWINTLYTPPKDGVTVMTRINDAKGVRNEQELKKRGNLWYFPDMSMYVYYTPNEWHPLPEPPKQ